MDSNQIEIRNQAYENSERELKEHEIIMLSLFKEYLGEKKIDILVYGVAAKPDDFYKAYTECSPAGWKHVIHTELDGMFLCTQKVGQHMEEVKGGSIILLSSIYGVVGNDQRIYEGSNLADVYGDEKTQKPKKIYSHAAYAAVKGAYISMSRYLAAYWAEDGIRVNSFSPAGVFRDHDPKFVEQLTYRIPLGRMAFAEEYKGPIVFLASDASSFMTGANLIVDGGRTAW